MPRGCIGSSSCWWSGLSPAQALVAATVNAAQVMGRSDLGTLAPGRTADLLLLDSNPLVDIHNARSIRWVMKDGVAHQVEELLPPTSGSPAPLSR
jgi:imidazolonepropionase-like amidohydrolase